MSLRRVIKKQTIEELNPYEFIDMQTYRYYPNSILGEGAGQEDSQEEIDRNQEGKEAASSNLGINRLDAEEIKRLAQQEAKQYIAEASGVIEQEKLKVFEEAKADGYQAGLEVAKIEMQQVIEEECNKVQTEIARQVAELEAEKSKIVEQYIDELVDISISIAEKIVKISLSSNGAIVKKIILSAVSNLKKTTWIKLYVGKSERGNKLEADNDFIDSISKVTDQVKIVYIDEQDTNIIETPEGIIDLSTKSQIETIKEIIHKSRG